MEGRPFTFSCVFNVKKRSWKGGVQVAVAITDAQIHQLHADMALSHWLAQALSDLPEDDRPAQEGRAHELFIQAVCWCKLDLLLHSGITQDNQCLAEDRWIVEVRDTVIKRTNFITSYIATELDLIQRDVTAL